MGRGRAFLVALGLLAAVAGEFGEDVDVLAAGLGAYFAHELGDFGESTYRTLLSLSADWDADIRRDLLAGYVGFPFWDALVFPIRAVADVGELDRVEVVRFSPEDVSFLRVPGQAGVRPTAEEKLRGVAGGHFAAFFSRDKRENDYLWGRLDAAERLLVMLVGPQSIQLCRSAFEGILEEEEPELRAVRDLVDDLREQVDALQDPVVAGPRAATTS